MPTRPLVTKYTDDLKLFPDRWHHVGLVLWSIALVGFPFFASNRWLAVGNLAMVTVVGAVGLMILTGFAGQISMGHAAFLALGAYTAAVFGAHLHLPFWMAIPAAGLIAAAVGLAVGPFALRLEGLYLAIVTLGLMFLVNHTLLSMPELTGGVAGMAVPMHWGFPGADASSIGDFSKTWQIGALTIGFRQKLYFLFLVICVVTVAVGKNIQRSNTGRAMMAVRDHDLAAEVLGVNPARAKILAFGISSFIAGVAGSMFAFQQQYITVEPPFDLTMSVQYIAIIVLGGLGTTFGAVAGALTYVVLAPIAQIVGEHLPLINRLSSGQQSTVLFSLVVCVMLVVEPLGILGIWLRIKRYFLAWPFRY